MGAMGMSIAGSLNGFASTVVRLFSGEQTGITVGPQPRNPLTTVSVQPMRGAATTSANLGHAQPTQTTRRDSASHRSPTEINVPGLWRFLFKHGFSTTMVVAGIITGAAFAASSPLGPGAIVIGALAGAAAFYLMGYAMTSVTNRR